jgi:hypothetical protein
MSKKNFLLFEKKRSRIDQAAFSKRFEQLIEDFNDEPSPKPYRQTTSFLSQ